MHEKPKFTFNFPKTTFADKTDWVAQVEHLLSEADEVAVEFKKWKRELKGVRHTDAMLDEVIDLMHSCETLARIIPCQIHAARSRIIEKNRERGYYDVKGAVEENLAQPDVESIEGLPPAQAKFAKNLFNVLDDIGVFLVEKNKAYGDSASDPVRIFSKSSPTEQINVRIDDKLSRLLRGNKFGDEDTEKDLLGYLILKQVVRLGET